MATKVIKIKNGEYKGKQVELLGLDMKVLGHSVFGEKTTYALDYFRRMAFNAWSPMDKRIVAKLPDGNYIILNKKELE